MNDTLWGANLRDRYFHRKKNFRYFSTKKSNYQKKVFIFFLYLKDRDTKYLKNTIVSNWIQMCGSKIVKFFWTDFGPKKV